MKKLLPIPLLMAFSIAFMYSLEASSNPKKVFLFHCADSKNIEAILQKGLKSKKQLEKEGVSVHHSTQGAYSASLLPDQDDVVYFQYLDPETTLKKIGPRLWQMQHGSKKCVTIVVNPDETRVHNGEMRAASNVTPDEKITSQKSRQEAYDKSAMTLRHYIEVIRDKEKENQCPGVGTLIHHPYTAEPLRIPNQEWHKYARYFPEYTVRDGVSPSELAL